MALVGSSSSCIAPAGSRAENGEDSEVLVLSHGFLGSVRSVLVWDVVMSQGTYVERGCGCGEVELWRKLLVLFLLLLCRKQIGLRILA